MARLSELLQRGAFRYGADRSLQVGNHYLFAEVYRNLSAAEVPHVGGDGGLLYWDAGDQPGDGSELEATADGIVIKVPGAYFITAFVVQDGLPNTLNFETEVYLRATGFAYALTAQDVPGTSTNIPIHVSMSTPLALDGSWDDLYPVNINLRALTRQIAGGGATDDVRVTGGMQVVGFPTTYPANNSLSFPE